MRLKQVRISAELVAGVLEEGAKLERMQIISGGLPAGAALVAARLEAANPGLDLELVLFFEHESFPETADLATAETTKPLCRRFFGSEPWEQPARPESNVLRFGPKESHDDSAR